MPYKKLLLIALLFASPLFSQQRKAGYDDMHSPARVYYLRRGATAHNVVLTWTPSTTPGVGYNIYRGTASGQESTTSLTAGPTAVNCAGVTCTYTDVAGLVEGTTYFYIVKAVSMTTNGLSVASNESSGMIPIVLTIPAAPNGLKITIQ